MVQSSVPHSIDRAQIEHVAKLACVTLTNDEATAFASELAAIVRYVNELSSVDTTDVPPTAHVQLGASSLRADEILAGLSNDEALDQAPRKDHGAFAVPGFVEG
jgi:aspartyl-tRNA(Asn)/glutamyl-tRNA(Gln) amidotransferase subunit C